MEQQEDSIDFINEKSFIYDTYTNIIKFYPLELLLRLEYFYLLHTNKYTIQIKTYNLVRKIHLFMHFLNKPDSTKNERYNFRYLLREKLNSSYIDSLLNKTIIESEDNIFRNENSEIKALFKDLLDFRFCTLQEHYPVIGNSNLIRRYFFYKIRIIFFNKNYLNEFVFRGQKRSELAKIIVSNENENDDLHFYQNIFYFGEKSKIYFSQLTPTTLKKIICPSRESAKNIFYIIRKKTKSPKKLLQDFFRENPDIFDFFSNQNNCDLFSLKISSSYHYYNYYNSFIHTMGKLSKRPSGCLSSTASYEVSKSFATSSDSEDPIQKENDFEQGLIFFYALPQNITNNNLTFPAFKAYCKKQKEIESRLSKDGLPIFRGNFIYNDQKEWVLTGGMFPQLIYAIIEIKRKIIIINPHMFGSNHRLESVFIDFDQSKFDQKLQKHTCYRSSFSLNGNKFDTYINED